MEKSKGPWQSNVVRIKFQWKYFYGGEKMKTREDKRTVKLDFFFFSQLPFLDIFKK